MRADYSLNEGGGERCVFGGNVFYLCAVGEKMSAPFRVHVRGRSGHASVPSIADNALVKAAPIIEALGRYQPPQALIPEVARFLELVLGELPPLEVALDRARALHPLAAELVEPLLSFTLAPTMIEASKQRNVIPATCVVTVDCRLPPGMTPEDVDPLVRAAIGPGDYDLEWYERDGGTRSPMETPLWSALEGWVDEVEPGARLAPLVCAGFTDSHWMREAFGTVAYGFFPQKAMDSELAARLIHSADERIPVDDLELGVHALRAAALGGGRVMDEPVRVTIVPNEVAADVVCTFLRAEGIRCGHRVTNIGRGRLGRRPERRRRAGGARRPGGSRRCPRGARRGRARRVLGRCELRGRRSRERASAARRRYEAGFSWWPPNCLRIAESTLFANSPSSREEKREYSAAVSTSAGTPSSIAAIAVQRPSPESETRPAKPSSSGDSCSAAAVRSSSHDSTTLPRRQTSVIAGTSSVYE